jgi:hypothetical protein
MTTNRTPAKKIASFTALMVMLLFYLTPFTADVSATNHIPSAPVCDPWPTETNEVLECSYYFGTQPTTPGQGAVNPVCDPLPEDPIAILECNSISGTQPTTPGGSYIRNRAQINLGPGVFPDVAWKDGRLWIAVKELTNRVILYSASPDLKDLKTERIFSFSNPDNSFPRLSVQGNVLWLAYRDGLDLRLWRSDADSEENLGRAYGNDPVALGNGYVAWQKSNFQVVRRNLSGGETVDVKEGRPTGVSRVLPDGAVKLIDEDRLAFAGYTRPWWAGDLVVAEGLETGLIVRLYGNPDSDMTLFDSEESFTPHAATDGAGLYAVATWGKPGVRIAVIAAPVCNPLPEDPIEILECNYYSNQPGGSEYRPGSNPSDPIIIDELNANVAGWVYAAYSEKSDSLLLVSQQNLGNDRFRIVGLFVDPNTLQPKGSVFRIDSDDESYHGLPKVTYGPEDDIYLVTWEDTRPCGQKCRSIYGRLISGNGSLIGSSDFAINSGEAFLSDVVYDPNNKRFVVGYERAIVFFRTVDLQGNVSSEYKVVDSFPYQGQMGVAVNTNKNEYWFAYATVYTTVGADQDCCEDDRIFFSRVNAETMQVIGQPVQLSKTRLGRLAIQGARIAYSPDDGAAVAIWKEANREGLAVGTWGRTIYDDGTMSEDYPVINARLLPFSSAYASGSISYNPWTQTFMVTSGDWDGNAWTTELSADGFIYAHELALSVKVASAPGFLARLLGIKVAQAADPGSYNLTHAITPFGLVTFASQNYSQLVATTYYSPNATGPGTNQPPYNPPVLTSDTTGVSKLVSKLYVWALGAAAILALLYMVFGGYLIITAAGNAQQASKGREYITSSIIGLAILISSYLILSTINPDLADFNLDSINIQ